MLFGRGFGFDFIITLDYVSALVSIGFIVSRTKAPWSTIDNKEQHKKQGMEACSSPHVKQISRDYQKNTKHMHPAINWKQSNILIT